jgi:hypothetical protein
LCARERFESVYSKVNKTNETLSVLFCANARAAEATANISARISNAEESVKCKKKSSPIRSQHASKLISDQILKTKQIEAEKEAQDQLFMSKRFVLKVVHI